MDIYFDIDGVLLGTESPIEDIIELLEYCLEHFPTSTYWLTTHCKAGVNRTNETLASTFPKELVERIYQTFQPTDWGVYKTDAINFDRDFLWFDDDLFEGEEIVLKQNYVLNSIVKMDLHDPKMAKKALALLKEREKLVLGEG